MKIGTLDIESLSLAMRAVVWEVAILTVEVNEHYEPQCEPDVWCVRLEILDQIRRGRHVCPDTLAFQERQFGKGFESIIYGPEGPEILPPATALNIVREKCKPLKELWINGLSFDSGRMHTLAEDYGLSSSTNPLWGHYLEQDIRGFRKKLRLPNVEVLGGTKHRAATDVRWNFAVIQTLGQALRLDVKPDAERKVVKES